MNEPQTDSMSMTEEANSSMLKADADILHGHMPMRVNTILGTRLPLDANISPDGKWAAFVVMEYVADKPRQRGRIWLIETTGGEARPLSKGPAMDTSPCWNPNSRSLAFISKEDGEKGKGKPQLYTISVPEGDAKKVCTMPNGASNPAWAPDGSRIAFVSLEGEEPKTDPLVVTPGRHQRLWTVRPGTDIPEPVTPDGYTIWDYSWSPDSQQLAVFYTTKPDETDWYDGQLGLVSAAGGAIRQLGYLPGQASSITWSPDGTRLAYVSGEWSDRGLVGGDLFIIPVKTSNQGADKQAQASQGAGNGARAQASSAPTISAVSQEEWSGEARNLTPGIECSLSWCQWFPDGQKLLYAAWSGVTHQIGIVDETSGEVTVLVQDFVIGDPPQARLSATPDLQRFVAIHSDAQHPFDVWLGELYSKQNIAKDISWRRLSRLNPIIEETVALTPTERIRYESVDGWLIDALFTPPLQHKGDAPPPLIVHVHGGPTWAWTDGYSSFTQLLAAAGYAVLCPNIRGSLGRGVAFTDAVLGDMGGKDFQDVLYGVEYLVKRNLVDGNRVGIMGGSYGGFMSAWAVTQTTRFAAAIMVAGVSDFHSFHAQSNIQNWDMRFIGANPLEHPDMYRQRSAVTFASRVTTPTLIIHGEQDPSVPVNQAYAFYRALRERGIPVELVTYPREGHSIREREHLVDYENRVLRWFEQYLSF